MMIPENWAVILNDIVDHIYEVQKAEWKDYVGQLFNVQKSKHQTETHYGAGEMGQMMEWNLSGNKVSYEDIDPQYSKTYTHKKYSKGFQVQKELLDDERYDVIKGKPKKLARVEGFTRQVLGMGVFKNAFSSAADNLGPDSKSLCNSAHPAGPSNTGTTFSNTSTLALTATNLETLRNNALGGSTQWKDDKGNMLVVDFDTILVPPALRKTAMIIADTSEEPMTSDHSINVWKGSLNVIECPFLNNSTTAWFMLDSSRMKDYLQWFDREHTGLKFGGYDFDTDTAKYAIKNRLSFGWDHWSFVYGSTGTG